MMEMSIKSYRKWEERLILGLGEEVELSFLHKNCHFGKKAGIRHPQGRFYLFIFMNKCLHSKLKPTVIIGNVWNAL